MMFVRVSDDIYVSVCYKSPFLLLGFEWEIGLVTRTEIGRQSKRVPDIIASAPYLTVVYYLGYCSTGVLV